MPSATLLARSRSHQGAEGVDANALAAHVQQHSEAATAAIADYFWDLRNDPSLEQADAVHTLLLLLLHQLDEHTRVGELAAEDSQVVVDEGLRQVLQQGGRHMAWAALCARQPGRVCDALDTWRALALGELVEADEDAQEQGM